MQIQSAQLFHTGIYLLAMHVSIGANGIIWEDVGMADVNYG